MAHRGGHLSVHLCPVSFFFFVLNPRSSLLKKRGGHYFFLFFDALEQIKPKVKMKKNPLRFGTSGVSGRRRRRRNKTNDRDEERETVEGGRRWTWRWRWWEEEEEGRVVWCVVVQTSCGLPSCSLLTSPPGSRRSGPPRLLI